MPTREHPLLLSKDEFTQNRQKVWLQLQDSLKDLAEEDHGDADSMNWPLSSRSFLLLGDRGAGKTTFLRSFRESSMAGPASEYPLVPGGNVIEIRSLDKTDRVLTVLVEQLSKLDRAHGGDEKARRLEWQSVRRKLVRSDELYSRFIASHAVSEAELVEYLRMREEGTDETRRSLRTLVGGLIERLWKGTSFNIQDRPPLVVFFLDDLDVMGKRAWEAVVDIDRYLTVSGLAYVFTGSSARMRLAISRGLFDESGAERDWPEEDLATLRMEARHLYEKYFPLSERLYMRAPLLEERLQAEVGAFTLADWLTEHVGPASDLFLSPVPVRNHHADMIPATPRGIRSLCAVLGRLNDGDEVRSSVELLHQLTMHSQLADAFGTWTANLRAWVSMDQPAVPADRSPSASEKVAQRILEAVAGLIHADNGIPVASTDFNTRALGEGELYPVIRVKADAILGANEYLVSRWVEMLLDFAMVLSPALTSDVLTMLGWRSSVRSFTFLRVPPSLQAQVIASDLVKFYVDGSSVWTDLGDSNLHLLPVLTHVGDGGTRFPPSVRGLVSYLQAQQGNRELGYIKQLGEDAGWPDLQEAWQAIQVAHVKACLVAAGLRRQPTARNFAELLPGPVYGSQQVNARFLEAATESVKTLESVPRYLDWRDAWASWKTRYNSGG